MATAYVLINCELGSEESIISQLKDLEGVIAIEIPFMLKSLLPIDLNSINNKSRNFAIGYDVFEIILLTKGAKNLNGIAYKGLTGKITFKNKRIQRKISDPI